MKESWTNNFNPYLCFTDPEPVYAQTKGIRKLKGRKAKVKSVELDETVEPRGKKLFIGYRNDVYEVSC